MANTDYKLYHALISKKINSYYFNNVNRLWRNSAEE